MRQLYRRRVNHSTPFGNKVPNPDGATKSNQRRRKYITRKENIDRKIVAEENQNSLEAGGYTGMRNMPDINF
jgi:hypothetical protein